MIKAKALTFFSLLCINTLHANQLDLMSLSLDELMQVEIYTASQEVETAAESVSLTSVITAQQLQDWGITNIHDVLSFLPGIVKSETYISQTTQTFRGVTPGIFNNKSLYLVNGHPSYESLFGSTLIDYIPIEIIERIEVVRSPASVLYGTNAISGVINIITKQSDSDNNKITLRSGSYNHIYGNVSHLSKNLSVSASLQRDDGYNYNGTLDEFTNPVDMKYKNNINNLFVDSYGEDWRLNLGYFDQSKALFGVNPWSWLNGAFDTYSAYLDLNKVYSFDTAKLNLWLRYDISDKDIQTGQFPFPQDCTSFITSALSCAGSNPSNRDTFSTVINTVERYSFEAQYKDKISDSLKYILGSSVHIEKLDPLIFIYDSDSVINPNGAPIASKKENTTSALYAQLKYQPQDNLIFVAGVRGEREKDSKESGLVPRIGATYQLIPDTYLKAMYSEAYRTPVFIEKYVLLTGVLFGNPELKRETIKTLELALDSQVDKNNSVQIALYTLNFENEILRISQAAPSTATEYINGKGKQMRGLEIEWKSIINRKIELILNASHTEGEDNSLNENTAPFIANHTANLILNYTINNNLRMGFTTQYIGSKDYSINRLQSPTTTEYGSINSYSLSNINLRYFVKNQEIKFIINNIFDEDYSYPEPVRRNIPNVPGGADRTAYLQYHYTF